MRTLLLGPYSQLAARRATAAALLMQWIIVVTGATVRLTGSGLGCPNWPTCTTTRAVPQLEQHALIEFANRMTAPPTLLAAFIATWVCWRLAGQRRRDLRIASSLVVIGILMQAIVGALTVLLQLPPEIVSVHFLLSIVLITASTVAWHAAGSPTALRWTRGQAPRTAAAIIMLVTLLSVIVAGVLTTASGPHSGSAGTGQQVDRFNLLHLAVTYHARSAFVFLALVLALTWARARRGIALRDLGLLLTLVAVQVTIGEIQYRTGLPWRIVLAHVSTAALLWLVAVRIAADALLEQSAEPAVAPTRAAAPAAVVSAP